MTSNLDREVYTYNNEAIGLLAVGSILNLIEEMPLSKAMLILPIILHDPTLNYLQRGNVYIQSLDQLIVDKVYLFSNFNKRFISLLPVSMNCIFLLEKMKLIELNNGHIFKINNITFENKTLGKRGSKVLKASENVRRILSIDESYLYLQLRVEL